MKRRCLARLRANVRVTSFTSVTAVCAAFGTPGLAAEAEPMPLSEVVVSATRTEERADAVASTVTSRDARQIERTQPVDETGLFADEPDIDAARDRARYGVASINIRGIEDNRVLQTVDGVRLPDFYSGGGPSNATTASREAPEFSFLKRVEALRGPASSLYGSDAIGGVVSYVTKDPRDLTKGRAVGGEAGLSWNGIDDGFGQTAGVAGGNDRLQGMFLYAHRRFHALDTKGTDDSTSIHRTRPNPQTNESNAWLGKVVWNATPAQRWRFAYEHRDLDGDTDTRRLVSSMPRVTAASGSEDYRRDRVSLDYAWTPANGALDRLTAQLYYQDAKTATLTRQLRSNTTSGCSATTRGGTQCDVLLTFDFRQKTTGFSTQADKTVTTGPVTHRLTGGAELTATQTEEARDGSARNRATGATSNSVGGTAYPEHDFPGGDSRQIGVFLQDEMAMRGGRFTVTPGLRFDHFALRPDQDAVYAVGATAPAIDKSDWAVSPKLSTLWRATDRVSLWAQYVFGFRAPNYQEVNGKFVNYSGGYGSAPNPGLEPEKSRSFEIGARYATDDLQTSVALFDNRYRDFIERTTLVCPGDPACLPNLKSTNQYRNQTRVRIYGAEWRGAWRPARAWRLDAAVAYAHGENEQTGAPLNSVSPLRASAGVSWEPVAGRGGALRWRGARAVTRVSDAGRTPYFRPPGYGVVDLNGFWRFNRYVTLNLSVNNLFDKRYWLWGDVRKQNVTTATPGVDFYSQPGRTFAAALNVTF